MKQWPISQIHGMTKEVKLPFALAINGNLRAYDRRADVVPHRLRRGHREHLGHRLVVRTHGVPCGEDHRRSSRNTNALTRYIHAMSKIPPQRATRIEAASEGAIAEAARLLREGRLVAFPTETVYGLGANALDEGRSRFRFCGEGAAALQSADRACAQDARMRRSTLSFNPLARKLADAFWPGALTLVLPRREGSALSLLGDGGSRYGCAARAEPSRRARAAHRGRYSDRSAERQSRWLGESDNSRSCRTRSLQSRRSDPRCRPLPDRNRIDGDRFRERQGGSASARRDHARGDRGASPDTSPNPQQATFAHPG